MALPLFIVCGLLPPAFPFGLPLPYTGKDGPRTERSKAAEPRFEPLAPFS